MTHFRSIFQYDTIRAWNLVDKTGKAKDFTLEITKVTQSIVKSAEKPRGEPCWHAHFKGTDKPLIINVTNAKTLSAMSGSEEVESWVGLKVTLYSTRVKGKGGGQCTGIRMKPLKAQGQVESMPTDQPVDAAMEAEQEEAMREPGDEG